MISFRKEIPFLQDYCQEKVIALLGIKKGDNFFIDDYYVLENMSSNKYDSYYVGKDQYVKASQYAAKKDLTFLGIIHTHLSFHKEYPSDKDYQTARNNMLNGILYNNKLTFYNKSGIIEKRKVKIKFIDFIIFNILKFLHI